ETILESADLRKIWEGEVAQMRERIKEMRQAFVSKLNTLCPQHDFSFINDQNGMFSYSGLKAKQIDRLRNEYGIYAVPTGRICMACLTTQNIDAITKTIAETL